MDFMPPERPALLNHPDGAMPYGSKKGRLVRFYKEAVYMSAKSREAGRPVHEERDFVEIISGPQHIIHREIKSEEDEIVREYYTVWKAYKDGVTGYVEGTRIDDYPGLSLTQKEDFKALRIYTVEQLADATDTMKQTLGPGANAIVDAAKAWLGRADQQAVLGQQAEQIKRLEMQIESMKRIFEENTGKSVDTSLAAENANLKQEIEKLKTKKTSKAKKEGV